MKVHELAKELKIENKELLKSFIRFRYCGNLVT